MRIVTIGDIHGLSDWKKIKPDDFDLIIFLGDYLDSFFIEENEMLKNLEEILLFKKSYLDKVKLLLGNHEISYLFPQYKASGYRLYIARQIRAKLTKNASLFQVAFQHENYLWSHAGIQNDYYLEIIQPQIMGTDRDLAATLERLYMKKFPPLFEVGPERGRGRRESIGGPFWLHSTRLINNPLNGYHQIVGHTAVNTIQHIKPYPDDNNTSVTLCDCLHSNYGKFYKLIC